MIRVRDGRKVRERFTGCPNVRLPDWIDGQIDENPTEGSEAIYSDGQKSYLALSMDHVASDLQIDASRDLTAMSRNLLQYKLNYNTRIEMQNFIQLNQSHRGFKYTVYAYTV